MRGVVPILYCTWEMDFHVLRLFSYNPCRGSGKPQIGQILVADAMSVKTLTIIIVGNGGDVAVRLFVLYRMVFAMVRFGCQMGCACVYARVYKYNNRARLMRRHNTITQMSSSSRSIIILLWCTVVVYNMYYVVEDHKLNENNIVVVFTCALGCATPYGRVAGIRPTRLSLKRHRSAFQDYVRIQTLATCLYVQIFLRRGRRQLFRPSIITLSSCTVCIRCKIY